MRTYVDGHHRTGHHVDGYMRRVPGSHRKVRIGGHHRHGHHVVGHHRRY